jgi:hypothetical protein
MSGPPLSRRSVVRSGGLLLGGMTWAGCDLDLDPGSASTPAAVPTPDPDQRLVLAARAELVGVIARIAASTGLGPLSELEQVHRTQLAALGGEEPAATSPARPLGPRQLLGRERVLSARFTAWAEHADSGDLARVLAAVAAGIRMHLAEVP